MCIFTCNDAFWVEGVAVECDRAGHDLRMKGDLLGLLEAEANETRAEHVLHHGPVHRIEGDQRESREDVLGADERLRRAQHLLAHLVRADLIHGNDGALALELAVLEYEASGLVRVDDQVVELAAGGRLERLAEALIADREQVGDEALDARALEVARRRLVLEAQVGKLAVERLALVPQAADVGGERTASLDKRRRFVLVVADGGEARRHAFVRLLFARELAAALLVLAAVLGQLALELAAVLECLVHLGVGHLHPRLLLAQLALDAQQLILSRAALAIVVAVVVGHKAAAERLVGTLRLLQVGLGCLVRARAAERLLDLVETRLLLLDGARRLGHLAAQLGVLLLLGLGARGGELQLAAHLGRLHLALLESALESHDLLVLVLAAHGALGRLDLVAQLAHARHDVRAALLGGARLRLDLEALGVVGRRHLLALVERVRHGDLVQVSVLALALLILEVGGALELETLDGGRDVLAEHALDLVQLGVLLVDGGERVLLLDVVGLRAGRLLDHRQDLHRLHVQHLGDLALHDQKIRIVHVQLHRAEQVGHALRCRVLTVDQVLVLAACRDLFFFFGVQNTINE